MNCTWQDPPDKNCTNEAKHPWRTQDGRELWAHLCTIHHNELTAGVASPDVRMMLRCWVRAGGGPKVMTARTVGLMTTKELERHGTTD